MRNETGLGALTPERLTQFTVMLREQQRFRQDQIHAHTSTSPQHATAAEAEVNAALLRGAFAALSEIEAALARMQVGTYGRCVACGHDIAIERLEVLPQTSRCTACERAR